MIPTSVTALAIVGAFFIGYFVGKYSEQGVEEE